MNALKVFLSFLTCAYGLNKTFNNISSQLDTLLDKYDRRLRPLFGDDPVTVSIDINIRSMGHISELKMMYSFDCYFRQRWKDERLMFNGMDHPKILQLNQKLLDTVWKPDTYIMNGESSYLHNITLPNVFVRIHDNGNIIYSMRLTIKATCPMDLYKFPMDTQKCPLEIASHGYTNDDLLYQWTHGPNLSVEHDPELRLSQFQLIQTIQATSSSRIAGRGNFSILIVEFVLKRNMGYFMIQLYVPCCILVIISWVSFWINREATSDRITLGVTTVLTMAFMSIDNKKEFPKVNYATALDIYVNGCFAFVTATIIQFAVVHYFTKHGFGEEIYWLASLDDQTSVNPWVPRNPKPIIRQRHYNTKWKFMLDCWYCLKHDIQFKSNRMLETDHGVNSVSTIDRVSRYGFPIGFLIFNCCYWSYYLYLSD